MELNPDLGAAWTNMGMGYEELDRTEDALKADNKAIKLNRDDEVALYNKAKILMKLGKYDRALETLDKVLDINPDHAEAAEARAQCELSLG